LINICGRKIKVQTGAKSQTVNICSSSNIHGQYEYIVRLRPPSVSPEILISQNFNSIRELVEYVETRQRGLIERSPGTQSTSPTRVGVYHPLLVGVEEICGEYRRLNDRDGLFFRMFEKTRANWFRFREAERWPSAANWVLRVAPHFTYEPTKHFEKQLQKQIAICLENQGWLRSTGDALSVRSEVAGTVPILRRARRRWRSSRSAEHRSRAKGNRDSSRFFFLLFARGAVQIRSHSLREFVLPLSGKHLRHVPSP
jgi:hypothetical protein